MERAGRSIRTAPSDVAVVVSHGFRPLLGSGRLAAGASAPGDAFGDGEVGLCGVHLEQVQEQRFVAEGAGLPYVVVFMRGRVHTRVAYRLGLPGRPAWRGASAKTC